MPTEAKLENWEIVGAEPQRVRVLPLKGKPILIEVDFCEDAAKEYVARMTIGEEVVYVDRDAMMTALGLPMKKYRKFDRKYHGR